MSDQPQTLDLERVKAYCAAATPGPWTDYDGDWFIGGTEPEDRVHVTGIVVDPDVGRDTKCILLSTNYDLEPELADVVFVASARTDLPAAVAEIERLRAAIDRIINVAENTAERRAVLRKMVNEPV